MSLIKAIKAQLGLGPAAENHFWDGSVPNQLSLKRGTPEAPGAELLKFLAGVASFPNQGQSLAANGYVKLPGGLIVQWGQTSSVAAVRAVTFPIPFPTACLTVVASPENAAAQTSSVMVSGGINAPTVSGFNAAAWVLSGTGTAPAFTTAPLNWLAIGY